MFATSCINSSRACLVTSLIMYSTVNAFDSLILFKNGLTTDILKLDRHLIEESNILSDLLAFIS